jgi:thiopurine S-methyltransferase
LLEEWKKRWLEDRIGWHEEQGNASLKTHWTPLDKTCSVLVPFCGKAKDLLWLASLGHRVIGIEISEIAALAFFNENDLIFKEKLYKNIKLFEAEDIAISIYCEDYFNCNLPKADALYDRGSLVVVHPEKRFNYVQHTKSLLHKDAYRFIITLEYEEGFVQGPPYSIMAGEMLAYWSDLIQIKSYNDIENSSPKFKKSGLNEVLETIWVSHSKI